MNITRTLRLYFTSQYLVMMVILSRFTPYIEDDQLGTRVYSLLNLLTYSLFYLLPALSISGLTIFLFKRISHKSWVRYLIIAVAYITTTSATLLIYADYQVYSLYEYHINAFVWNLLTTPGGIESLGATISTQVSYAVEIALLLVMNLVLLAFSHWWTNHKSVRIFSRKRYAVVIGMLISLLLTNEVVYAYNHYMRNDVIPQAASVIPFHLHTTSKSTFNRLGFAKPAERSVSIAHGKVNYPLRPVDVQAPEKPLNIVWLVAESLRWDMLDPTIMPNLSAFSRSATTFNQHYSGGNRTRMGMFSMFYGLDAPYWYSFEEQRVSPVIMDVVQNQKYQMDIRTSQSFNYPELRHTVFASIPEQYLHEPDPGMPAWKRDEVNITSMIANLERRDPEHPFFNFMFFEATHAPYTFDRVDEIAVPYLADMNYARLSSLQHAEEIKNRYINAAHSVDRQIGRLIDYLQQHNLLENTIVLVTGDHGEEFMEKGHWGHGHNAKFPEEQIRVPLVLHLPGRSAEQVSHTTSHLDIVGTLLPLMGVVSPMSDYSLGGDLFDNRKPVFVVGNYNYVGIIGDKSKIVFPFRESDYFHYSVFHRNDDIASKQEKAYILKNASAVLDEFSLETSRFIQRDS